MTQFTENLENMIKTRKERIIQLDSEIRVKTDTIIVLRKEITEFQKMLGKERDKDGINL